MAAPLLQAQVDINAPVAKVWALVSDFDRMPQWSPQCRLMKSLDPLRQGARTININRRKFMFWPTTCTVTEHPGEEAGIQGECQRDDLELRAGADRCGHPRGGKPSRR